jgi:hypothetical protein
MFNRRIISIHAVIFTACATLILVGSDSETRLVAAAESKGYLIYPLPAELILLGGAVNLTPQSRIWFDAASLENAELLHEELESRGLSIGMESIAAEYPTSSDIVLQITTGQAPNGMVREAFESRDGYLVSVSDQGIRIVGSDAGGQLYGILCFLQFINDKDFTIPRIVINEWPAMTFRGLRGHFPKDDPHEIEQFKRIIRAMAICRLNQLWIRDLYVRRFPASLELKRHPELNDDDSIPQALALELIQYARRYNVRVMGSVSSTSDIAWFVYPELIEMKPGEHPATVPIRNEKGRTLRYRYGARFNFCPSAEQTYRLLFDIIDELAPLFTSEIFDLGVDEVSQEYNGSRWVADVRCRGKDPVLLFAEYVNKLADYVMTKDKIPLVNSTPFIREHGGDFYELYRSVRLIRKNIMINNWSDGFVRKRQSKSLFHKLFGDKPFSSREYFADHGLHNIIHMVAAGGRWKDRPELLENEGEFDIYGAFITHYTYMTGEEMDPAVIDGMSFSGKHFWRTNKPEINSNEDQELTLYARRVIKSIMSGKSFLQAFGDARLRSSEL